MQITERIAEFLKKERDKKFLTNEKLAHLADLNERTVSGVLRFEKKTYSKNTIKSILDALELEFADIQQLMEFSDEEIAFGKNFQKETEEQEEKQDEEQDVEIQSAKNLIDKISDLIFSLEKHHPNPEGIYYICATIIESSSILEDTKPEEKEFVDEMLEGVYQVNNEYSSFNVFVSPKKIIELIRKLKKIRNNLISKNNFDMKKELISKQLEKINDTIDSLENHHSNPEGIYYICPNLVRCSSIIEDIKPEETEFVDELLQDIDCEPNGMGSFNVFVSPHKIMKLIRKMKSIKQKVT